MFSNVTGGYNRLGYIVPINSVNWGWNVELIVNHFDVSKTAITTPSNESVPFSSIKLTQEGSSTVMTLLEPYAQGNAKRLVLMATKCHHFIGE